jgi:hypothetical protein
MWSKEKDRIRCLTELAAKNSDYKDEYVKENSRYWYWTRTPSPSISCNVCNVYSDGSIYIYDYAYYGSNGVLPALYLKSDICKSGEGSKNNPYIV